MTISRHDLRRLAPLLSIALALTLLSIIPGCGNGQKLSYLVLSRPTPPVTSLSTNMAITKVKKVLKERGFDLADATVTIERRDQWEVTVPAPPRKPNEIDGGPVKYTVDRQDGSITRTLLNVSGSHMPPLDRMKATTKSVRLMPKQSMSPETSSSTPGEAVRIVHRRRYEGAERNAFPDKPIVIDQPMWLVRFSQDELKVKAWVLASGSIYFHLPRNPPDKE